MDTITVKELTKQWNTKKLILPDWQRVKVWSNKKASKYIENLLNDQSKIMSHFTFSVRDGDSYLLDGYQRTSAIVDFINNKVKLSPDFKNKTFDELTLKQQETLLKTKLKLEITKGLTLKEEIDFFQNINSGKPLSKSQLNKAKHYRDGNKNILVISKFTKKEIFKQTFNSLENKKEPELACLRIVMPTVAKSKGWKINKYVKDIDTLFDKLDGEVISHLETKLNLACAFAKGFLSDPNLSLTSKDLNQHKMIIMLSALITNNYSIAQFKTNFHKLAIVYKDVLIKTQMKDMSVGSTDDFYSQLLKLAEVETRKILGKEKLKSVA